MKTRLLSIFLALAVLSLIGFTVRSALSVSQPASFSLFGVWANRVVRDALQRIDAVEQLAPSLMLLGGAKEQDGIFIVQDYLLENITASDETLSEQNTEGIRRFAEQSGVPVCVTLIPTAVAIKQQEIPITVELYNQKAYINAVYASLSGEVSTADAYTPLFSARGEYTYYRTASNLTGLGGYYVYSAVASRLGLATRPLDQFEIEHLSEEYCGDLYERSSYKGVRSDLLTLYRFTRNEREYMLTCTRDGETRTYYTLFPTHLRELGRPQDAILGGSGQISDIRAVSPYAESLLVFCDDTVLSYLPFLAVHYGHVTAVNTESATDEQLASINPEEYSQVLFAYSVKTFLLEDAGASRLS